jgi:hypothetical protein
MMDEKALRESTRAEPAAIRDERRKKAYVPPKLVEYGSASKLSAVKPGPLADGPNMMS